MRRCTAFLIIGGILVFSFGSLLAGQLPPGVRMGQGVGTQGVLESTYGPQPADPFAGRAPRVMPLGEDLDQATLEEIKKRVLTPGRTEGATLIQAPPIQANGEGALLAPSLGANFAGPDQGSSGGGFPPDPCMAAGPNHVIVSVNTRWSIYSKTGVLQFTTPYGSWFSSVNPAGYSPSDPKVMYDHYSGRWIVMIIGFPPGAGAEGAYLISVSDDSDPNGFWYKWSTPAHIDGSTVTTNLADYPGVGYDSSEAVYITSRQFGTVSPGFKYAKIRVLKKSELYRTDSLAPPLTYTDFVNMTDPGSGSATLTIKPAITQGPLNGNFLLSNNNFAGNYVELWRINDPAGTPTLVHLRTDTVGSYSDPPNAGQPPPGCPTPIDAVDARITAEVNYRNGYLYFAFATGFDWGSGPVSAIKYIQMDTIGNLVQNIIYGADGEWFFFPAPYPVRSGEVGMVYSHSSSSSFVSARYVGNFPGDLSQGVLKASTTAYCQVGNGRNRWGDYSAAVGDPTFPRRVWMFHQYAPTSSSWGSWCGFITMQNHRPEIANPSPLTVNEGDTLTDTVTVTDPDGESITSFAALSKPAYATFTNLGGGRGVLRLTPGCFDAGVDTVKLRAIDNGVPSAADTELVQIIVNEKNARPVLSLSPPDTVRLYPCCSTAISITVTDCDNGPSPLTIFTPSLPGFASLFDSTGGKGSLTFSPIETDVGNYSAAILAADGEDTTMSTVPIKVLPKGDLNGDGVLTASDVVSELNCVFLGSPPPVSTPCNSCDLNGDGFPTASDVILLLNATFLGTPLPAC